jgi:hypothetical protein
LTTKIEEMEADVAIDVVHNAILRFDDHKAIENIYIDSKLISDFVPEDLQITSTACKAFSYITGAIRLIQQKKDSNVQSFAEDDPMNDFMNEIENDNFQMDVQQNPLEDDAASSDEEQVKQMKENVKSILASKNLDAEKYQAVEYDMDNIDEDDESKTQSITSSKGVLGSDAGSVIKSIRIKSVMHD